MLLLLNKPPSSEEWNCYRDLHAQRLAKTYLMMSFQKSLFQNVKNVRRLKAHGKGTLR
jgi:hypothetical protein